MDELRRYSDSSNSGEEGESTRVTKKKRPPSSHESSSRHSSSGSRRDRPSEHSRSRHYESNRRERRSRSRSHDRNIRSHDRDRSPRRRPKSPPRRKRYHSPEHRHDRYHDNSSRRHDSTKDVKDKSPPVDQNNQQKTTTEATVPVPKDAPGPLLGTKPLSGPVVQPPMVHPVAGIPPSVLPGGPSVPATQTASQMSTELQIEAAVAAAQALARGSLPAYMNPNAMNPTRFQTLQEKKKKLWSSKKKDAPSHNQWEKVSFGGEGQGTQSKFRRLMGIGKDKPAPGPSSESQDPASNEHTKRLSALEEQYESSRYLTHIARGAGLGYGTTPVTPPTTAAPTGDPDTKNLADTTGKQ